MSSKTFAWGSLLSAVVLVGMSAPSHAITEVAKTGDSEIGVGGRMNLMGLGEISQDTIRDKYKIYLFQKNSRLEFSAKNGDQLFYSQLALGAEDTNKNSNVNLTLLDMYTKLSTPVGNVVAGQFKVPFSLEELTEGGNMLFNKRSLLEMGFRTGRDYGLAYQNSFGPVNVVAGVFSGGGRDVPERYIPVKMGIPMTVLRVGVGELGKDLYSLPEPYLTQGGEDDSLKQGLYVNGIYTKNTLVGHSSVLGQRNNLELTSILFSPNWNPYAVSSGANSPKENAEYWAAGVDYSLKNGPFAAEAEVLTNQFKHDNGQSLSLLGARAQASYDLKPVNLALRYSMLIPDEKFQVSGTETVNNTPVNQVVTFGQGMKTIHEIAPAITWHINGHNLKLIADLPIMLNAPVVTEPGIGDYNLINQPDQTSYLATKKNAGAAFNQHVIIQGRLGLQYQF